MQICQNGPLDKFMRFLLTRSSALCTVMCGAIKIYAVHDQRLTRIICINKSHAEICHFRVLNNNKISVSSKTWGAVQ